MVLAMVDEYELGIPKSWPQFCQSCGCGMRPKGNCAIADRPIESPAIFLSVINLPLEKDR